MKVYGFTITLFLVDLHDVWINGLFIRDMVISLALLKEQVPERLINITLSAKAIHTRKHRVWVPYYMASQPGQYLQITLLSKPIMRSKCLSLAPLPWCILLESDPEEEMFVTWDMTTSEVTKSPIGVMCVHAHHSISREHWWIHWDAAIHVTLFKT
eukprot:jgi/Psemu1/50571/gm1.50571_g